MFVGLMIKVLVRLTIEGSIVAFGFEATKMAVLAPLLPKKKDNPNNKNIFLGWKH